MKSWSLSLIEKVDLLFTPICWMSTQHVEIYRLFALVVVTKHKYSNLLHPLTTHPRLLCGTCEKKTFVGWKKCFRVWFVDSKQATCSESRSENFLFAAVEKLEMRGESFCTNYHLLFSTTLKNSNRASSIFYFLSETNSHTGCFAIESKTCARICRNSWWCISKFVNVCAKRKVEIGLREKSILSKILREEGWKMFFRVLPVWALN